MTLTIDTEPERPWMTPPDSGFSVEALEASSSDAFGVRRPGARIRVMGRIEMRESGDPLPGALVRIEGLAPLEADRGGRFLVESIPVGRHAFEVEHPGREPMADTLVLESAEMVGVTIRLEESPSLWRASRCGGAEKPRAGASGLLRPAGPFGNLGGPYHAVGYRTEHRRPA
jgi:hypothetical protein